MPHAWLPLAPACQPARSSRSPTHRTHGGRRCRPAAWRPVPPHPRCHLAPPLPRLPAAPRPCRTARTACGSPGPSPAAQQAQQVPVAVHKHRPDAPLSLPASISQGHAVRSTQHMAATSPEPRKGPLERRPGPRPAQMWGGGCNAWGPGSCEHHAVVCTRKHATAGCGGPAVSCPAACMPPQLLGWVPLQQKTGLPGQWAAAAGSPQVQTARVAAVSNGVGTIASRMRGPQQRRERHQLAAPGRAGGGLAGRQAVRPGMGTAWPSVFCLLFNRRQARYNNRQRTWSPGMLSSGSSRGTDSSSVSCEWRNKRGPHVRAGSQ